jgi:putative membrane protein
VRVFHTEKGSEYYFESGAFLLKLTLFVIVGLLSIYPTREFLRWRPTLREGRVPQIEDGKRRKIRMFIHLELTLIAVIILLAIMMARGLWFLG